MMKVKEFIERISAVEKLKTVYMWGTFGSDVKESLIAQKTKQYPSWYTEQRQHSFKTLVGKGYFAFDCVGLIKGIIWGWTGDCLKPYGGAKYNNEQDLSANGMMAKLIDASSDFRKIIPGAAVWMDGHIGVYIGEEKVIECTPKWENGVQVTACLNIGRINGYNGRQWTKWGKLPFIDYQELDVSKFEKELINKTSEPDNWIEFFEKVNPKYKDATINIVELIKQSKTHPQGKYLIQLLEKLSK